MYHLMVGGCAFFDFRFSVFRFWSYRLTSSDARPHLMHDFAKSSITNNFFNIDPINIILALLEFYNLNNLIYIIKIKIFFIYN